MAKVLLVTGGSRGIGAATAKLAAERGYDVAINFRADAAAADRVVCAIRALGRRAIAVQADVSVPDDVVRLFKTVDRELGTLSALVNSAGIGSGGVRVEDSDPVALERLFRTNVIGRILASREAVRRMSARRGGQGGVIVNVSSMAATIGGAPVPRTTRPVRRPSMPSPPGLPRKSVARAFVRSPCAPVLPAPT